MCRRVTATRSGATRAAPSAEGRLYNLLESHFFQFSHFYHVDREARGNNLRAQLPVFRPGTVRSHKEDDRAF